MSAAPMLARSGNYLATHGFAVRAPVTPKAPDVLVIIGARPWWLYSCDDYRGFSDAQIRAGLSVPAIEKPR